MMQVTSKDGTKIVYEREGSGPVIILVDGALCSRAIGPMKSVADHLSGFSVIRYDRRGRGESSDTKPYSIEREVEDLAALVNASGEEPFAFGISSGAALVVHAAMRGLPFKQIALFEPPVVPTETGIDAKPDHAAMLGALIASDRRDEAVKYFMSSMIGMPKFIVGIMRLLPMWKKLRAVAPTLPYDALLTRAGSLEKSKLQSVQAKALVIWGEKSPPFLREAAAAVASSLPSARGLELKGQNHSASGKALAPALNQFFGA